MRRFDGPFGGPARVVRGALVCLAMTAPAFAGTPNLYFERIGSESGPPPEVITSIYQDRAGFMWIGSRDGLTLYDGYSFTVFDNDASDPHSISGNTIRTIFEDSRGSLWLGTNTGGLNRLDRATGRFEQFRHDSADPRSLSHDSVYSILEDRTGALWVGTQSGLNRLDRATSTFEQFVHDPRDPGSLSHDYVFGLYEDREGSLWVSTIGGGLNVRDPDTGTFTAFRHDPDDPASLSSDSPLAMIEDPTGALWVSSVNGVNRLDRSTGSFDRIVEPLSDPLATSLVLGPPGKLWVGTHGGGLDQIDLATGEVHSWMHDAGERHSLSDDDVIAMLGDRSGALWIGTWGGGLNRLTPSSLLISTSAKRARMPDDLDSNDVTSLAVDRRGGIWIGTRSGGVVRRAPERMDDRHYLRGGDRGTPRNILHIVEDLDGLIWIGTSGGIVRLDPATGEHIDLYHRPGDATSLGPGYVNGLLVDRAGRLWVGTGEGGLQSLDADGRVVERFLHDPDDPASLSDNYVSSILEDLRGTLWIGTRSGGLNALNPRTGRFVRYLPSSSDETSISHHFVTSMIEDSAGVLWIGTGGGGLNRIDVGEDGSPRFTRFTESGGLTDDDVMAIQEGDDGTLWISTKRGLARFDPLANAFANLFVSDGLPAGEFEPASAARSGDTLYFGSVKGLVAIPSRMPFPASEPSPTTITSIRTAEGEVRGERPVWELEDLGVPWGEWLSVEFAVLDYGADHRHRYEYRLGGERAEWIGLGSRREITFSGLGPGAHEFSVRGRNSQGVWSVASSPLRIEVIPPFWMTAWFRSLMLILVVGLAVVGHRMRLSGVEKRNRKLVALYEQREKAREELGLAYERLRRLTRRLEAAKEEERRHIARELHDEMGPALTAVIINLQLLSETSDPNKATERISDTIEVVDRLVDRIRDLSLDLRPPLLDELGLMPALRGYLESHAERSRLDIDVRGDTASDGLPPELEIAAFRVVQEAVTNVVRHAKARHATVNVSRNGGTLRLSVKDDGRGFDVRATLDGASGRSLGLLGMQERVGMLGGEVEIESVVGKGTEVRARMPIEIGA